MRDRQEIKKRWAQLRMPPVYQRIEKHGAAANKELPPQLPRLFQRPGTERAHAEALDLERPRRKSSRDSFLRPTGGLTGSRASCPERVMKSKVTSRMVRAMGPIAPRMAKGPSQGGR